MKAVRQSHSFLNWSQNVSLRLILSPLLRLRFRFTLMVILFTNGFTRLLKLIEIWILTLRCVAWLTPRGLHFFQWVRYVVKNRFTPPHSCISVRLSISLTTNWKSNCGRGRRNWLFTHASPSYPSSSLIYCPRPCNRGKAGWRSSKSIYETVDGWRQGFLLGSRLLCSAAFGGWRCSVYS